MWHRVIPDELQVGELRPLQIEGKSLLIGRTEQGYFAVLDRCSHENQPLSEADGLPGRLFKGLLECPHHGAKFDPHTGQARGLPAIRPIKTFPVKVEGGYVWVELE
jgi:3-phenylpropionate/trans-cinnamate dioxygenase ferredoxin component